MKWWERIPSLPCSWHCSLQSCEVIRSVSEPVLVSTPPLPVSYFVIWARLVMWWLYSGSVVYRRCTTTSTGNTSGGDTLPTMPVSSYPGYYQSTPTSVNIKTPHTSHPSPHTSHFTPNTLQDPQPGPARLSSYIVSSDKVIFIAV